MIPLYFVLQLLYGLQYYKGDERIKEFISDLIAQEKDGGLKNHSGLCETCSYCNVFVVVVVQIASWVFSYTRVFIS